MNLQNTLWFGPIPEAQADEVARACVEGEEIISTFKRALMGEIPPSQLLSEIQMLWEAEHQRRFVQITEDTDDWEHA